MFKLTKKNICLLTKNPLEVLKSLSNDDIANILQQANNSYYNDKDPVFSDQLYDMIKDYLEEIDPNNPILKNIGAAIEDEKRKAELPYFMGSLDKIKGDINKFKEKYPGNYVISDKLDGNSGLMMISKGVAKLYTRGDGKIGQDISHVLPFIKGIPDITKQKKELAVRGELIISKNAFEKVKSKGANARNMVAGMLNAKIPDLEIARSAEFVAYEIISPKMEPKEQMEHLEKLKFCVVYNKTINEEEFTNDNLSKTLMERRETSPYDIDGIVVMHNTIHKRIPNGNPTYGFAFKSVQTMAKAEVIVQNVEWNLSKDGYLVPTIIFGAVSIDGVVIKRATGFNGKFIKDNKIGPGSRIMIMRAGLVIPHVEEVLSPSETGEPQMPDNAYIWTKTGVDIMLSNEDKKDNEELKLKTLQNFVVKIGIVGLGPGNIKKMYDSGIQTPKDIFMSTVSDLLKVDGFKDKSAQKIYDAIQGRKNSITCLEMMDASNVMGRGLAGKKLKLILDTIPDILKTRYVPTITELVGLKGVEKTTASLFISNLPLFFKFVDDNGLNCMEEVVVERAPLTPADNSINFTGEKIVFTGVRNKELEKYIVAHGGEIASTVSKKTTMVLAKDVNEEFSKIEKAKALNIKIMQVDEFIKKNGIPI